MAKKKAKAAANTRRKLLTAEEYYLWMVGGGICSYRGCNKRLILTTDNGKLSNIGIKAHIIGHSEGSARHEFAEEYGYAKDDLEQVSNMMYMCYDHSKKIDDKHTRQDYPPILLFEMKKEHEDWVKSWTENNKKKSIALIYKKLGPPFTTLNFRDEQPPTILIEAIEDQNEFTTFTEEGWQQAKQSNEELFKRFKASIIQHRADVAEIFPLSPIPLLIHLGRLSTDTVPLTIYQYDRDNEIWVTDSNQEDTANDDLGLAHTVNQQGESNVLVVTISVSGTVHLEDVEKLVKMPYDHLGISISNPGVKRVLYMDQVKLIQKLFKDKTEELLAAKRYRRIHLFYAGPAGLAIELGRSIHPTMWPEVSLYEYNFRKDPVYQYVFSI
ncbi:SAVED domain-containing protein [Brevibacillus agri]|uniref:SAVED domain-containing protein n=1 Tax=Brevibacillus TaxID=55080 RepID=UPI00203E1493|nr:MULTISPECIES: SAVED domain-containing protein [Brevibacillus]MCM3082074.1 SAVED domain-containing protein [Brevibacillus invocatus]MCM3432485.1 SAVED domain-containing protein [Brevibacillus invocatus]MED1645740.1 SAVED domain-containing protein [Brevibacillus agri]MED1652755.1 SAVED domain-containing protein [Brevibacillus agri]MED1689549.1 SAVED domain-containing protein [Brevibacillus agri]